MPDTAFTVIAGRTGTLSSLARLRNAVAVAAGVVYPIFGILLSPMIAAAAMSVSSANALRLSTVKL
ncbi:hypothetical protein CU103_10740 [Phyllobacterium sophorae]|uniref:Uncharacterized protein n=1 Tax=Phyllobacterium sophorae TaxID=1520277 RepID=A0A2P7BG35_9HYPH|nr:hypothetical protein CU103_10740 [Phyllobacterium sophorae]